MTTLFARFISYFFHPALIPTLLFAVLFFTSPCFAVWNNPTKLFLLGFVFLGTFAFPVAIVAFMLRYNQLQHLEMPSQADRKKAFLVTSLFYASLAVILRYGIFEGTLVEILMLGIALTVCIASIINLYYRISMHAVGIFGGLGVLFALQLYDNRYELFFHILSFILLGGAVSSSRLALEAHTPTEVLVGTVIGFGVSYVAITLAL